MKGLIINVGHDFGGNFLNLIWALKIEWVSTIGYQVIKKKFPSTMKKRSVILVNGIKLLFSYFSPNLFRYFIQLQLAAFFNL